MVRFARKIWNCMYKLKFGTNSFECGEFDDNVHFHVLDVKYPFSANLTQNINIVCLSWNLVPRLCWIGCWRSVFSVIDRKYPKLLV